MSFNFTFSKIKQYYEQALLNDYTVITCEEFARCKELESRSPTLVNRVDIDLSVTKADRLRQIFKELGIKASFFVRLHAPEYNPFSFENYRILKAIRDDGHEIGYHSEIVDQAAIWNEDPQDCLLRDVAILNNLLDIDIKGVASHGGSTGLNNLDFWREKKASTFGLLYEAYDSSSDFGLFETSFYISDSEWTQWKCYDRGVLREGDRRTPAQHFEDRHPLVYMLIHPDTYYENHIYE